MAGAPVSFGAFEVTVGVDPNVPEAAAVLDAVQRAGYLGIDLGPPGYLGNDGELRRNLERRGLYLAGGYLALPFSEPDRMGPALVELNRLLDLFDGLGDNAPVPPRPTLADAGSEARRLTPGRAHGVTALQLDRDGWVRFTEGVRRATELSRERGYEPTFHHHGASFVETPGEIAELIDRTEIGLCLDTGHLVLGGGDPRRAIDDWGGRINHVHLKDVRREVIDRVIAQSGTMIDFWRLGAFCPLGEGDLDIDGILGALRAQGFAGWLVVEQDMLPRAGSASVTAADQQRNRDYLRARGL